MGLLDAARAGGRLARGLRGQLLAGRFAPRGLTGGLLGTGHVGRAATIGKTTTNWRTTDRRGRRTGTRWRPSGGKGARGSRTPLSKRAIGPTSSLGGRAIGRRILARDWPPQTVTLLVGRFRLEREFFVHECETILKYFNGRSDRFSYFVYSPRILMLSDRTDLNAFRVKKVRMSEIIFEFIKNEESE